MSFHELYCNASTGSNMNGGSDESATAKYAATNGGWDSTTGVFTPTSGDPSAVSPTLVGQVANVFNDGATTPVFLGRVTAVSSTTLTVSTTAISGTAPTTSATARSVNVGGVLLGPLAASDFPFDTIANTLTNASGNLPRINLKNNAAYTITAAMVIPNTTASSGMTYQGYTTTPGDGGRATINRTTSGASFVPLTLAATSVGITLADMIFDGNGTTSTSAGVVISGRHILWRVSARSMRGAGISVAGGGVLVGCEAEGNNESGTATTGGILVTATATLIGCMMRNNANANLYLTHATISVVTLVGCVFAEGPTYGIISDDTGVTVAVGCVAHDNITYNMVSSATAFTTVLTVLDSVFSAGGNYGIKWIETPAASLLLNNAFYSNGLGETDGLAGGLAANSVTLSGDPFVDAANGDFDLNNTAGAGAACRGAGYGAIPQANGFSAVTLGYPDIGASQHADAGGGGGPVRSPSGLSGGIS